MAKRYHNNMDRNTVIRYMASCAIRDREEYIDSWSGARTRGDVEGIKILEEAERDIENFKRVRKTLIGS